MTVLAEITEALQSMRVSFVQDLVNAAVARIRSKGTDHGPVLVNVTGPGLGVRTMIHEVGQILGLESLYIDLKGDGQSFELSLPTGAEIDRSDMRFVILDGWRNDRAAASIYLRDNFASLHAANTTILIIIANFEDPYDLAEDVGAVLGNELWREASQISVETPEFFHAEDTQEIIRSAREAVSA